MKLRLHIDREYDGIVMLEASPQMRTLHLYSQNGSNAYVPLPYLIFVVRYIKRKNTKNKKNEFIYPGLYGLGLHVYGRTESLSSINDNVFFLPTDFMKKGLVCTDHDYDNKAYKNLPELVNEVISIWYSSQHFLENIQFSDWKKHTLKNISSLPWGEENKDNYPLNSKKIMNGEILIFDGGRFISSTPIFGHKEISFEETEEINLVNRDWPENIETKLSSKNDRKEPYSFKNFNDFCWFPLPLPLPSSRWASEFQRADRKQICRQCYKIIPSESEKEFFEAT